MKKQVFVILVEEQYVGFFDRENDERRLTDELEEARIYQGDISNILHAFKNHNPDLKAEQISVRLAFISKTLKAPLSATEYLEIRAKELERIAAERKKVAEEKKELGIQVRKPRRTKAQIAKDKAAERKAKREALKAKAA